MARLKLESKIGSYSDRNRLEITMELDSSLSKESYDNVIEAIATLERVVNVKKAQEPKPETKA